MFKRWVFNVFVLILLVGGLLPAAPVGAQAGPVKEYNVSAIDVVIAINRFGDHDPGGKMFVLDENIPAVRERAAKPLPERASIGLRDDPIQPLVIRANIGDTVVINFTNRLRSGRASMHIHGLPRDPKTSAGSNLGLNPDTTVAPGQSIKYTWFIPDKRNMEGAYVFNSMGDDMRQQQAHGLFGVFNVEPKGSTYLNPIDGKPLKSGWEAIIVDPSGKDFREDTIIYHEWGDESFRLSDREGSPLPLNDDHGVYRPGSRALNYRSEPFFRRQELAEPILGHEDRSQDYGSYMFGDPPTPMPRGYIGDPTKRRIVHGGSERAHMEHLHGGSIRWAFNPFAEPDQWGLPFDKSPTRSQSLSQRLDVQGIGPLESYTVQTEGAAGGLQAGAGEFLFHCHFGHHYPAGMWSFWRVFDTLQTAQTTLPGEPPMVELPDRAGTTPLAVDSTQLIGMKMPSGRTLTTGPTTAETLNIDDWMRSVLPPQGDPGPEKDYDASVWDWAVDNADPDRPAYLSEPETTAVWANYASPTPGQRRRILFNPGNARPAFPLLRPQLGRRPPFAPGRSGSPWLGGSALTDPDPLDLNSEHPDALIPANARRLEYTIVTEPISLAINKAADITSPSGRPHALLMLDEDRDAILAGRKPQEQLSIRANVGDGVDIIQYDEVPDGGEHPFFKANIHIHFVQFDTQASDGVISGMSYEQSVRPYKTEGPPDGPGGEPDGIKLAGPAPAGSTAITVDAVDTLKVNAFIGIGFGVPRRNGDPTPENPNGALNRNGGFEWAQIVGKSGNTLTLDRPLLNAHTVGQFVGVEFTRSQWLADVEEGTTYYHNHVFAPEGFGAAPTGTIIVEPRGSQWLDQKDGVTPVRSGSQVLIKTEARVAPGIPAQNFHEFVLHSTGSIHDIGGSSSGGGEPGGYNMKQEPLDQKGVRTAAEPSLVFSSARFGDPETPLLRTYVGDLVAIRLLASAGHDDSTFHLAGHRFRVERFDPREAPRDTITLGIAERFDLFLTAGSVGLQAGDYVYMNSMSEKMMDGAWGILRVNDTLQPDLAPTGGPRESIRESSATTFPQNRRTGGSPPAATEPSTLAELKTKLELNGYSLMDGKPVDQIPVRTYDVAAIETEIRLTEGFEKSNGRVYVLAEDEQAVLDGSKDVEPLVLRGNVGEVVRVNFANKIPGARASLHLPELIKTADSLGAAFGFDNDSTVASGRSTTYWYVIDPRFEVPRSMSIVDFGEPGNKRLAGLYGAFIVEPEGSTYHDPQTGEELKSGAGWNIEVRSPEGAFRDVALIFHDEDPRINRDLMPYDPDIDQDRAINYRAEPFEKRNNELPAHVLSTRAHGDPGTPLIEVEVGEQVRLHALGGFGHQPHVFALDGHRFPFEGIDATEMNLYARMFGALDRVDAVLEGGAGGIMGFPGDYLIRDGRNPFFEGGLWGILRVNPKSEVRGLEVNVMGNSGMAPTDNTMATRQAFSATSPEGICTISLAQGTRLVGPEGALARLINANWNLNPPPAQAGAQVVLAMDLQPSGAGIDPAAQLIMRYSGLELPPGTSESDLFIAEWDGDSWREVESTVDTVAKTVSTTVDGLEMYALMVRVPPPEAAPGP
ncbi:MAG: multicopper oxidase domain-containing protein [Chloroflexi bacterium]|nr:multicopper oxidase domain-containing protein [Chloroflexota bacterium]